MKEFKKRSIFTQQIYSRLIESEPGDIISYNELEVLIGMSVQAGKSTSGYGYLTTARNMCLNNDEIVFRPVTNEGLEHLVDGKLSDVGYNVIGSLRRKSKKGIKEVSAVKDFSSLSNTEKVMHNTARSVLGMFEYLTRPKKVAILEDAAEKAHKSIPFNETIKLFE
ncbi:MAG: hypothetical protein BBJ57_02265 [Desulfobacterales bacterium PC51MH44]|nr:MAG: hypothetical protein BBJ57_02265 [Desulfobacterales bacterium PC51MH44]